MTDFENKMQVLNFIILFVLIIVGCLIGRYVMNNLSDSVLGFNVPAIGVLAIGELVWLRAKGLLKQRWNRQESHEEAA